MEEWSSSPPHLKENMSSFRDYLSDITGEDQLLTIESLESDDAAGSDDLQYHRPALQQQNPHRYRNLSQRQPPPPPPPDRPPPRQQQPHRQEAPREQQSGRQEEFFPKIVSPFAPEFRRSKRRDSGVTWDDAANEALAGSLSLADDRIVSVVVHVRSPPAKTSRQQQEGRLPCVFPMAAFSRAHLEAHEASSQQSSSPTAVAMNVADETRKVMVVNPTAFGKHVPNKVSMEVLKKIVGRGSLSSEDWAREFRFSQVLWPAGALQGFARLARAVAQDLTAPASIAHRTVFSYGHEGKLYTLFGTSMHDSVAQSFARPSDAHTPQQQQQLFEQFGLVGLTVQELLKFKQQEHEQSADEVVIGLSMMEITGEEKFHDLSEKWNPSNSKQTATGDSKNEEAGGPRLKLIYDGEHAGGDLAGLKIHEMESLKSLGHFFRRAFRMANSAKRETKRGHVLCTLYLYRNSRNFGMTTKLPVAHFCDLATPTAIDLSKEGGTAASADSHVQTRRNANVRKSVTALGAVLRACLLREAGNSVTLSFRESMLTKVLQKSIDHQDGRTILLTSISPMVDQYDKAMEYLRFSHRLFERPGEPPKSPFDTLSRAVAAATDTNTTSPTSQTSEQSERISLSEFDEDYHPSLLQTLTSDARQRLSKAGFRPAMAAQNEFHFSPKKGAADNQDLYALHTVTTETVSATTMTSPTAMERQQPRYEELDPGDFDDYDNEEPSPRRRHQENERPPPERSNNKKSPRQLPMSLLPTPQARNLSSSSRQQTPKSNPQSASRQQRPALDTNLEEGPSSGRDKSPSPQQRQQHLPHTTGRTSTTTSRYSEQETRTVRRVTTEAASSSRVANRGGGSADDFSAELRSMMEEDKRDRAAAERNSRQQQQPQEKSPRQQEQRQNNNNASSNPHSPQSGRPLKTQPAPKLYVAEDATDNDTVSQIGEIDASYVWLSQNQHANADAVSRRLQALRESEQSIIKRISAERDALRVKLDRHSKEHQHELMSRDRELRELGMELEKVRREIKEFEQLAEAAIAGQEQLEDSVKEKEARLRKMEAETVAKESFEELLRENERLADSLQRANEELRHRQLDASSQKHQMLEMESSLRNQENLNEQHAQDKARDAERIRELEELVRTVRSEVSTLEIETTRMRGQAEQAEERLRSYEDEAKKRLEQVEANHDVVRAEMDETSEALKAARNQRDELRDLNDQLRREVIGLEETLRRKDEQIEALQKTAGELSNQLDARAADVTDLAAAAEELEAAKQAMEQRLQEESTAKARAQSAADNLQEALSTISDETRKRLEPLLQRRKWDLATARDLSAENKELHSKNRELKVRNAELLSREERLLSRIERMQQDLRDDDRRHVEEERNGHLLYRGPPLQHVCQMCKRTVVPALRAGSNDESVDPSKEQLEDLALDLSLIVRQLPSRQDNFDLIELEGFEQHIAATERISDDMLKTLRRHVHTLRRRKIGGGG